MSKKIWFKGQESDKRIEKFTVGKDRSIDKFLAPYDVLAGMAHVKMLAGTNQISGDEKDILLNELKQMYDEVSLPDFELPEDVEDIHSYVELTLTNRIGPAGKKLHIGRQETIWS